MVTARTTGLPALGNDVDLNYQSPTDLGDTCEKCCEHGCVPMATVSWDDDTLADGSEHIVIGRACLPAACDMAREYRTGDRNIAVDMPAWGTQETADLALASYRQLDVWSRQGLLTPENQGAGSGHGRERKFLADDLDQAKRLAALVFHGLNPRVAHHLLTTRPDIASGFVSALDEAEVSAA